MNFGKVFTFLLAAVLIAGAALAGSGLVHAQQLAYHPGREVWRRAAPQLRHQPPVYVTPAAPATPWVWSADGWRYPNPATPAGTGLLGF